MNMMSSKIAGLVFRRIETQDMAKISFDSNMLAVLMEIDGKRGLAAIAEKTGLSPIQLKEVVEKLFRLKLIEHVPDVVNVLDDDFFNTLNNELSMAIGPIAEFLIEDTIGDLGHNLNRFPEHRAAELVEILAREISREEKKIVFQRNMLRKINEIS